MSVIDAWTRKVTNTVAVGNKPSGLSVDARTHNVYVANEGDDTVSVMSWVGYPAERWTTTTVPVGKQPSGMAVDQGTRTIYVAHYRDNTMLVVQSR